MESADGAYEFESQLAAFRANPPLRIGLGLFFLGRVEIVRLEVREIGLAQEHPASLELIGFASAGEEAVSPDFHEARGQNVLEKASGKGFHGQAQGAWPILMATVFVGKGDHCVGVGKNA